MCFPLSTHRVICFLFFVLTQDSVKKAFGNIYQKIFIEKLKKPFPEEWLSLISLRLFLFNDIP